MKKLFSNYPDVVSVNELMRMLNIGKNTAHTLLQNGTIKSIKIGIHYRIPKQNNTYYAVLNLKVNGKYKQKWVSTKLNVKGNKGKVQEFLNKLMIEHEEKEAHVENSGDILFTDYLEQWLEKKKKTVNVVTYNNYLRNVKNHLAPYFDGINLYIGELKPKHISSYYDYEILNNRNGRKLSFSSLKAYSQVLNAVLNQAVSEELINKNPAFRVPIPKTICEISKAKFLTAKEANELLKIFEGHWLQPIVYITLYYGLRRGEVLGLKWSAVDFESNSVKINHTVTYSSKVIVEGGTKTGSSRRTYVLLPEIKELLLKLKKEQDENRKLFGSYYYDTDYVFTHKNGKTYRPDSISKAFSKKIDKNGFVHMRFHDLRHSCASVLHDKGWDLKDIQTWLGHSNISTTANIYTHISASRKMEMAKDIQNTFSL